MVNAFPSRFISVVTIRALSGCSLLHQLFTCIVDTYDEVIRLINILYFLG